MMLIFAAAMALLAPSEPQTASAQGEERLALPMADGFVTVFHESTKTGGIEERVPRGENYNEWTRMITLLQVNSAVSPEAYLANFQTRVATVCRGTRVTPQIKVMLAGRRMIEGRINCPNNPETKKPETFFYRIYEGSGRLYMLQVTFRSVPTDEQIEWARKQLADAAICGGAASPACATGGSTAQ